MKLLNQHFSSKTWTNFDAFSLTSLRLIFILIQEYNTRSLEYQSLKRQPDAMCFEGSHQGMSGKTTKYRFQPHSEQPAESLPNTKTHGSYMKLLRWCHECLSIRLWCNIDCMASFTELFQSLNWECSILEGFRSECQSQHFGESSATKSMTWGSWGHTTKKDVRRCVYGMLSTDIHDRLCMSVPETILCHLIFFLRCLARPEVIGGLPHRHGIPLRVVSCRMFQTCRNGWYSSYYCYWYPKSPYNTNLNSFLWRTNVIEDDTWSRTLLFDTPSDSRILAINQTCRLVL